MKSRPHASTLSFPGHLGNIPARLALLSLFAIQAAAFSLFAQAQDLSPAAPRNLSAPEEKRTEPLEGVDMAGDPGFANELSGADIHNAPLKRERSGSKSGAKSLGGMFSKLAQKGDKIRITCPPGSLIADEDAIYSSQRSVIEYGKMKITADSFRLDQRLFRAEASGHIVLESAPDVHVEAEKCYFNFRDYEGVLYGAKGKYDPVFFRHNPNETAGEATFQVVNRNEALVQNSILTSCDFPIPHYYFTAKEILIFMNDRVMMRGATLYVANYPIAYLPAYTRSLKERSPWFFWAGFHSKVGPWFRLGYTLQHEQFAPNPQDDSSEDEVNRGKLDLFVHEYFQRGPGGGFQYDYRLDRGKHEGHAELFYVDDSNRDIHSSAQYEKYYQVVKDGSPQAEYRRRETRQYSPEPSLQRFNGILQHRTAVSNDTNFIADINWLSDPDLPMEMLDTFADHERNRVMERDARLALLHTREQMTASLVLEIKDRIGRDRVTNYANPADILADFDNQPELPVDKRTDKGISSDRWGRVTMRAPEAEVGTGWIPIYNLPWFGQSDLHMYNNLDKGLNTLSTKDDAFVQGADWYNALMTRIRFDERTTWMHQFGVGVGASHRDQNTFGYLDSGDFAPYTDGNGTLQTPDRLQPNDNMGGVTFRDPETFYIGKNKYNLQKDVQDGYAYADYRTQFQRRLTDSLTLRAEYNIREATSNYLGDWYARMGNRTALDDLYDYPLREHNVKLALDYALADPRLVSSFEFYRNLESSSQLYPYELVSRYGNTTTWTNRSGTLKLSGSAYYSQRQIYSPNDPESYINGGPGLAGKIAYSPVNRPWWVNFGAEYSDISKRTFGDPNSNLYVENGAPYSFETGIGGKVGPKYTVNLTTSWRSEYHSFERVRLAMDRDIHDAVITTMLGFKQDPYSNDQGSQSRTTTSVFKNMDFRIGIKPKLPGDKKLPGTKNSSVLQQATNKY